MIVLWIVLGLVLLAVLVLAVMSQKIAKSIAQPKRSSLAEEEKWEKDLGLWDDFDELNKTEYQVAGKDGYVLHCELVDTDATRGTGKYVIISHGFTSNRLGAVKYVDSYISQGFSCVIYDLRDHGENAVSACTIGNWESEDLKCLIEDTYQRYGEDIYLGLHGESMGSSTSLSVLKYQPNLRFVVADCGFANLYELIETGLNQKNIGWLTPMVNLWLKIRWRFDMKETSAVDCLKGNRVPVCFIHGAADDFIAPENSQRLQKATRGYSELHLVPDAKHAQSVKVIGKKKYTKIIAQFVEAVNIMADA